MIDGGLRRIFRKQFPDWQWTSIETGAVAPGTPDSEFCTPEGISGWIEYKSVKYWKVSFRPLQPSWIYKRARFGGRVFIIVKRADKELFIIPGKDVLTLEEKGLRIFERVPGIGPSKWDWDKVKELLLKEQD